jgi:hypothetical protein
VDHRSNFLCLGRNVVPADVKAPHETLKMRHGTYIILLTMFSEVTQMLLEHLEQAFSHEWLRQNVVLS